MFIPILRNLLLAGYLLIGSQAFGQGSIIADPNTVIKHARKYYGTEERLNAVESIYYEGEVLDPKGEKPNGLIRIFLKKPYFQRLEIQMGHVITIHCVNGLEGYHLQVDKKSGRKKISVLPADRVETLIIGSLENLNFLQASKIRAREVSYMGQKEYQGESCHELLFKYGQGVYYRRMISAQTGRVVMTLDHQGVEMHHRDEIFSKGIRFTKILESYKDNKHINTLHFNLVLLNQDIPDSFFDFPNL